MAEEGHGGGGFFFFLRFPWRSECGWLCLEGQVRRVVCGWLSGACDGGGALSVAGAWRKGLMAREVDVVRRSTYGRKVRGILPLCRSAIALA